MDILPTRAVVKDNGMAEYHTHVQISFRLERCRRGLVVAR